MNIPIEWDDTNGDEYELCKKNIYEYLNKYVDRFFYAIIIKDQLLVGVKDTDKEIIKIFDCTINDEYSLPLQDSIDEYNVYTCQCSQCTDES